MKNIETLIKEYTDKNEDLILRSADYTHSPDSYICDIISEVADSEIDIYYSGLFDWLKNDPDSVENIEYTLREFGTPTSGNDIPDFMKILQQGQYYGNEQKIYNNINDFGKIWLLYYLKDVENITELTDEQAEKIEDLDVDSNDKFADLLEKFKNED